MLLEFFLSIVANLATAALLAVVAFGLSRRRRRQAQKFFGIRRGQRLRIYLSSIHVLRAHTSSPLEIARGFRGEAISGREYKGAVELSSVVTSRSSSILARAFLGDAVDIERITAAIDVSPIVESEPGSDCNQGWRAIQNLLLDGSCTVLIGGPIYNSITLYLQSGLGKGPGDRDTYLEFVRRAADDGSYCRGISVRGGSRELGIDEWVGGGHEYFLVEKLSRSGMTIFICAGTSVSATAAAVRELVHWRALANTYTDEDFGKVFVLGEDRSASKSLASLP